MKKKLPVAIHDRRRSWITHNFRLDNLTFQTDKRKPNQPTLTQILVILAICLVNLPRVVGILSECSRVRAVFPPEVVLGAAIIPLGLTTAAVIFDSPLFHVFGAMLSLLLTYLGIQGITKAGLHLIGGNLSGEGLAILTLVLSGLWELGAWLLMQRLRAHLTVINHPQPRGGKAKHTKHSG